MKYKVTYLYKGTRKESRYPTYHKNMIDALKAQVIHVMVNGKNFESKISQI